MFFIYTIYILRTQKSRFTSSSQTYTTTAIFSFDFVSPKIELNNYSQSSKRDIFISITNKGTINISLNSLYYNIPPYRSRRAIQERETLRRSASELTTSNYSFYKPRARELDKISKVTSRNLIRQFDCSCTSSRVRARPSEWASELSDFDGL